MGLEGRLSCQHRRRAGSADPVSACVRPRPLRLLPRAQKSGSGEPSAISHPGTLLEPGTVFGPGSLSEQHPHRRSVVVGGVQGPRPDFISTPVKQEALLSNAGSCSLTSGSPHVRTTGPEWMPRLLASGRRAEVLKGQFELACLLPELGGPELPGIVAGECPPDPALLRPPCAPLCRTTSLAFGTRAEA